MIDHISLHVRDFEASKKFYAAALAPLGYTVIMEFPGVAGLGEGTDGGLCPTRLILPFVALRRDDRGLDPHGLWCGLLIGD